jgi:hypothetical protein
MKGVEDDQGRRPDLGSATSHALQPFANPRHIGKHPGAYGDGPEGELIPRQEITGKVCGQDPCEQPEPDHPVESPRTVKASSKENPQHVEEDYGHENIGAPVVDVPYQTAKKKLILETDDRVIRPLRCRFVGEHHQHPGGDHDADQDQRAAAESESVGVGESAPAHTQGP